MLDPVPAAIRRLLPDAVLLGVAVVWGGSYLGTKDLAAASSAAAVLCGRFVPAAVILLAISAARGRLPGLRGMLRPGLVLGALRAATLALETIGVTRTSATNAGLIIGMSVLLTPLFESAARRRRLSAPLVASLLLGIVGIALLVSGNGFSAPNQGDLLVLAAAVTRALLGVAGSRSVAHTEADVLQLTTVEVAFGAAVFAVAGGGPLLAAAPRLTAGDWAGFAYLSVGCTILAFLGQLWATKHSSASRAGILLGTEPAWALAIGVVVGGERVGPLGLAGAGVLLVAVVWGGRAEREWRRADAVPI